MKEADLNYGLDNLINKHTQEWGIGARYPSGKKKIIETFNTHFEAEFWLVNVINPFARDKDGKRLTGAIIVKI